MLTRSFQLVLLVILPGTMASITHGFQSVNGGFETPSTGTAHVVTVMPGAEPAGFGWHVEYGNVEVLSQGYTFGATTWSGPAAEGQQWVDIDGFQAAGAIYQDIPTIAGASYILTLDYAKNPAASGSRQVLLSITDVSTNANLVAPVTLTRTTSTYLDYGWTSLGPVLFTPLGASTRLRLASLSPLGSGSGLFLDDIRVGTAPTLSYCFGDGSATGCPCGNTGAPGNGCANSLNPSGANLSSIGNASLAADTLHLVGAGMPESPALYFQGTNQVASGLGVAFGDGLRCVGGTIVRLGIKTNASGTSVFPDGGDPSVSSRGAVLVPGIRYYQVWYRNSPDYCTTATFNVTNGRKITWVP